MTPTNYKVVVQPQAYDDVDAIVTYIAQDSPQHAAAFIDKFYAASDSLTLFPQRYRVYRHRSSPERSVRSMPFGNYNIFYRVDDSLRIVHILTVRHAARRPPRSLP